MVALRCGAGAAGGGRRGVVRTGRLALSSARAHLDAR